MGTTKTRGFTLIELLVGMGIFMLIIFLTLAVWSKAQHVVERSKAVMRLHYNAYQTVQAFEYGMKTSTPCAPMILARRPERVRFFDSEKDYYNINAFSSAGYGSYKRSPEDDASNPWQCLDYAGDLTSPYSIEEKWVDGIRITRDAAWGWYSFNPVYVDGDGNHQPIPIDPATGGYAASYFGGNPPEGYRFEDDPRGYPYDTYVPSLYYNVDPFTVENRDYPGGNKVRIKTDGAQVPTFTCTSFMMQWCTNWQWDAANSTYKGYAKVDSNDITDFLQPWSNRVRWKNQEVAYGMVVKPGHQGSDIDELAYAYKAINGDPYPRYRSNVRIPSPYIRKTENVAGADFEWSTRYGEIMNDGEVQYMVTAPSLEFAMNTMAAKEFKDKIAITRDGAESLTHTEKPYKSSEMNNHLHPFVFNKSQAARTSGAQSLSFYHETPAVVGICLMSEKQNVAGSHFIDAADQNNPSTNGYFSDRVTPHGSRVLNQPRWVRLVFKLVDDSQVPVKAGDTRVTQTFDHWVMIR